MADFEHEALRHPRAAGYYCVRQGKGDHERWHSPIRRFHFTVKVTAMKSHHTANETLKQAGLPKAF